MATIPTARTIALRACADAIANACDPNNPNVGVKEVGGNNRGDAVELYQRMAGAGPGDAWCAAFANARYRLAASRLTQAQHNAALTQDGQAVHLPTDFPCSAAVASYKAWAKRKGLFHSVADIRAGKFVPRPGDMVIFDWDNVPGNDHCGIVRGYDKDTKSVLSVEGNTSPLPGVSRESNKGDGVWKKSRGLGTLGVGGGVIQIDF